MKLLDIACGPWAIEREKLTEIMSIYDAHLKREKIDLSAVEAKIGKPLGSKEQGYEVEDGVAIIPIDGVICKRANLMSKISGGASTELIKRDFQNAMQDDAVDSIILDIESPGGAVNGTQELANAIYAARGKKPIVAFANGQMCSAAYWIGAAADSVIIADDTTAVGSIGVVAQHVDISQANKKAGVKRTEIFAGKFKRIASENEPLSKEGKADIQSKVDYLYSVFVDDVAKFRGQSAETVVKEMADGRVFLGKQAIEAGLVDGVSTLDDLIDRMAGGDLPDEKTKENEKMANDTTIDRETLAESNPELIEAIRKEGFDAGVSAETDRIKSVFAAALPGHDDLVQALAFDGKTTGAEAALQIVQAEQDKCSSNMSAMQADADEVAIGASVDEPVEAKKGFDALVEDKMADGASRAAAVRAVVDENPSAHAEYLKSLEA